ncbi:hypothetical protein B0H13DRAFT_1853610 [Mycena leptocephala]|nr:hypothetical protein B0H13DRAFT_1853610 [Mycena leptocephala]
MTSDETNDRLISLRTEKPQLWNDLQTKSTRNYCPGDDEEVVEDIEAHEDEGMGAADSEIPAREVIQQAVTKKTGKNCKAATAGLISTGEAENMALTGAADGEGSGKHKRCSNTCYKAFWRHANDKNEDVDMPGIDVSGK